MWLIWCLWYYCWWKNKVSCLAGICCRTWRLLFFCICGSAGVHSVTQSRFNKYSKGVIKNVFLSFSPDIIHHIIESNELNFSVGQGHRFQNQHGLIRLHETCQRLNIYCSQYEVRVCSHLLGGDVLFLIMCNMI